MSELFKAPSVCLITQIFLLSVLATLLFVPIDMIASCSWDVKLLWMIFSTAALRIRLFSLSEL